jgi:exodeoxyribonuclease V gamma subunit
VLEMPVVEQDDAYRQLRDLVAAYHDGMQTPLPVACRSAFCWLAAPVETAREKAQARYDGDDWNAGEVDYDAYLARFFPNFASLFASDSDKDFAHWVDNLYRPMLARIRELPRAGEASV